MGVGIRIGGYVTCTAALTVLAVLHPSIGPTAYAQARANRSQQTGISVESSPQLFAVMCALYAAGFEADASTAEQPAAIIHLRQQLLAMNGPPTEALRAYYQDHLLADPGEILSRYISFGIVAGPPPKFTALLAHAELPPDVLQLEGFDEVLARFYSEAHLEQSWAQAQPGDQREAASLNGPVSRIVTLVSAYLREIARPASGRSFTVLVEPLVGKRINFRNYGDHYTIVVPGGSNPALDEIRHAYLHFLIDPLPLKYRDLVDTKAGILDVASSAPRLEPEYQSDFVAFLTECLIKAVELRLNHPAPGDLESALAENDASGFVLVRPLLKQLHIFEKAQPAFSLYFPDLIKGINLAAEKTRVQSLQFAALQPKAAPVARANLRQAPAELQQWLAEGDEKIAAQDALGGTQVFARVLQKYPGTTRALYGLGVCAALQGDVLKARELFEQVIAAPRPGASVEARKISAPDVLAWSHIYLGRIHDVAGQRDLALDEYRSALAVAGAPESALNAAQHGIAGSYGSSSGTGTTPNP